MRIVHYLQEIDFRLGGPPRAVVDLTSILRQRGHDVSLWTIDPRDIPESWSGGDAPRVVRLPRPSLPGGIWAPRQLAGVRTAMVDADVLHLHGVWERSNAQIARLARAAGTPWCVTLRGMLDDWSMAQASVKKRLYLAMAGRAVLERAAFVHCTAQGELEQSGRWFPRGNGRVIPNLMDLSLFETLPGPDAARAAWPELGGSGPHLLFLSRIHVKKGIEHLLEATPRLVERFPDLQVYIAGTGDDRYIEAMRVRAEALGIARRTHFLGQVGGIEKLSLYQAASMFVLPTSQENFGFVQFEALACSTPVMTTRLVDTWDQIVQSGGGIAVEQSADAIVQGLAPLLGDTQRLIAMGAAGREWVLEHLATERVVEQIEAMYRDAAGG